MFWVTFYLCPAPTILTILVSILSQSINSFSMYSKVTSTGARIQLCFAVKWQASGVASSSFRLDVFVKVFLPILWLDFFKEFYAIKLR